MRSIRLIAVLVTLLVTALIARPGAAVDRTDKPMRVEAPRHAMATVVDRVDYERRTLTFKGEGDQAVTARATRKAKYLDEVKKGDRVNLIYLESVAVVSRIPNGKSHAGFLGEVVVAPLGTDEDGFPAGMREVLGTIENIDKERRILTFKASDGLVRTMHVAKQVRKLKELDKGDPVDVKFTEPLLIRVELAPLEK